MNKITDKDFDKNGYYLHNHSNININTESISLNIDNLDIIRFNDIKCKSLYINSEKDIVIYIDDIDIHWLDINDCNVSFKISNSFKIRNNAYINEERCIVNIDCKDLIVSNVTGINILNTKLLVGNSYISSYDGGTGQYGTVNADKVIMDDLDINNLSTYSCQVKFMNINYNATINDVISEELYLPRFNCEIKYINTTRLIYHNKNFFKFNKLTCLSLEAPLCDIEIGTAMIGVSNCKNLYYKHLYVYGDHIGNLIKV